MRSKRLTPILATLIILLALTGCKSSFISFQDPAIKQSDSIPKYIAEGEAKEVGQTYQTRWFDFTVQSLKKVNSYAKYKPQEGCKLYKAELLLKGTWTAAVEMTLADFYMDDPSFEDFIRPLAPLDETMMPEAYSLNPGQIAAYTLLFEVPETVTALTLNYTEFLENGAIGKTFSMAVK